METARAIGLAEIAADRTRVQEAVQSAAPPGAQLHVLAIGVGDYANHEHLTARLRRRRRRGPRDARCGRRAARSTPRSTAAILLNADATRREVLRALRGLGEAVRGEQGDVVVIHFSGHGALVDGRYYLLPHDVEMDDETALEDTAIPIEALRDRLAELGASAKVVVLLDACHSGVDGRGQQGGALAADIEAVRAAWLRPAAG